jgi:hypothetical protein
MKTFFKRHPETLLIIFAALFLGIVAGYYAWGIPYVAGTVSGALNYIPPQSNIGYDLPDAAKLDLRGLVK